MPIITIIFGTDLITLGLIAYFGAVAGWFGAETQASPTALIPAAFGVVVMICGLIALNEKYLKHAMHAAAAIMLLGALATFRGVLGVITLLQGGEVNRPVAAWVQAIMFLLCVVFVLLAISSFVQARRARQAAEMGPTT